MKNKEQTRHAKAPPILDWKKNFSQEEQLIVYRTDANERWSYPTHTHKGFFDIFYISSGSITHWVNGQKVNLLPGQFFLTNETDIHAVSGKRFTAYNINVNKNYWTKNLERLGALEQWNAISKRVEPWVIHTTEDQRKPLEHLLESLILHTDKRDERVWSERFITTFLTDFAFKESHQNNSNRPIGWLNSCLQHIEEHLSDPELKAGLPQYCSRSAEHISRSFRQYFQTTPSSYINQRRIDRAASLLTHSNRPIVDICFELGFENLNYFYKLFKQQHNQSPGAYRKAHQASWL